MLCYVINDVVYISWLFMFVIYIVLFIYYWKIFIDGVLLQQ